MQLQTFKAQTMAECLTQVKSAMGVEAIILHTRTYKTKEWLGLRRREIVEITAGKGMKVGSRPRPGQGPTAAPRQAPIAGTYARGGVSRGTDAPRPSTAARTLMEMPAATGAAMMSLTQEVTTLKQMMKDLLVATRQKQTPQVPEELFEYYEQLIQSKVCQDISTEIIKTISRQVRAEHYTQQPYMRDKITEQIERCIPLAGPIARGKCSGPHIVALIGPTGVGKTTTIAKLAANLKLRERHRVGLITLDTYRIAAVDQLRRYAEIIGAPLKVVSSSDELREAIRAMADLEYVLIDTAGRSPNDKLKLNELKSVLESAQPHEVHLVLSTTASQESMELAVGQFSDVRTDKLLFTKLDEAAHLGVLLNVVKKVNKPLSYVTTGQDVPDDIEVGQGKRLARLIMGEQI